VSVINKMLQELDRRDALSSPGADIPPRHVHPVEEARGREWFWRIVGASMLAALAWVGWVAYQLQPRSVATEKAFQAADQARTRGTSAKVAASPPAQPAAPVPQPPVATPAPEISPSTVSAIEPKRAPEVPPVAKAEPPAAVSPPVVAPAKKPAARRPAKSASPNTLLALNLPPAKVLPYFPQKTSVQLRERTSASDRAEREFRRAVELLKQGRAAEAEDGFSTGLTQDPSHRAARQALVALNLERGQLESARRLLQDGLALDATQPDFAFAMARILVERKDFAGALEVMERAAAAAASHADFNALRGTILQQLGRHPEAADAYQTALQAQSAMPNAWVGLGISLEALERRPEAAEAFRRALAAGPAGDDLKTFAERRIRALR
jgi:MSHA biogenesis protein MshN